MKNKNVFSYIVSQLAIVMFNIGAIENNNSIGTSFVHNWFLQLCAIHNY